MTTQNKKLIYLGLLLSVTTFIASGTAIFHMINEPNNVSAEQVEEDTYTVIEEVPDFSDTTKSSDQEITDSIEEPVVQEEAPIVVEEPVVQESPTMTINILDRVINYQNGGTGAGQSIIDANPYSSASTWGGSSVQSGNDGLNTHFIGHNPGIFDILFSVTGGTVITITDEYGIAATYTVQNILTLDDYGDEIGTGTNYFDFVVGSAGGERVTFQTCINDSTNLIIVAYA